MYCQSPRPPHKTTARQPLARTPFWLLAGALGLALAACGGGGGAEDASGGSASGSGSGAGSASGNGTSASGPATFIAASGSLCARRNGATNNCVQPTSSAIEELALIQTLLDPNGPVVDFDGAGHVIRSITTMSGTYPNVESDFQTPSYGLARRNIQAGRNAFSVEGRAYTFQYISNSDRVYKSANDSGSFAFFSGSEQDHKEESWSLSVAETQTLGKPGSGTDLRTENSLWTSNLDLLTDQAHAPKEQKVVYVGTLNPMGGTGARLNQHTRDRLSSGVTYEAVLDTATGRLSGVRVDYTDPESQRRTVLEMPELRFENSRLDSASRMHRISARMEGPGDDPRDDAPLTDTARTQLSFTLDGLEGEITGPQGRTIRIVGGGPKGILQAVLLRKDLAENDFVINIPLAAR